MTHPEQLLLVAVLLVPLILLARGVPRRLRLGWAAAAIAAAAAVVLPWAAYNTARFDRPVLMGTELGVTVAVSNCRFTYSGEHLGFQDDRCYDEARRTGRITAHDLSTRDGQLLRFGVDYARDQISRVPVVLAAREARVWGLIPQQARLDRSRGTKYEVIMLGFVAYWMLLPAAVMGAVILWQRHVSLLPLVAFAVTVSVGVALTYGFTRFRAAAEVPLVLLAAVTVGAVVRRLVGDEVVRRLTIIE